MTKSTRDKKRRLLAAIAENEKRKKALGDLGDGLARRLSDIIAADLGIVVGRRYKLLPRPGNAYTVTVKSIGTVSQYHAKRATKPENLYIGVLVYCERRHGHDVFRSEWVYTDRVEFISFEEEENAAPTPKKAKRSGAGRGGSKVAQTTGRVSP